MKVIFCLEKRYSWKIAAKIVAVAPKYQLFTDATTMYCNHYSISFFLFFHSCHELIIFCHILYTQQYIGLIVKRKAHQLLAEGNKIVTKKRRNRFVVGFMCKSNKSPPTIKVKLAKRRILFFFSPAYIFCCL